jgi:acyl-CoA reductase-like NAD-dependent aldehyde dehydrogenase
VTRVITGAGVHDELVERIAGLMREVSIRPGIEDADLGPVISATQLERVKHYVDDAAADGVELVLGGSVAGESAEYGGYFYEPTLIDGVRAGMRIEQEEVFGPVLSVLRFDDEEEAVATANGTRYGLVAGVWTKDVSRAHRVAASLSAGQVYVNGYGAAGGVELPFGGYKQSGFGREKGIEGLSSYLQTKNVCVRL